MSALRILVADDHEVVRRGVRALIEGRPDWTICGEASSGRDVVHLAQSRRPDIVVLDLAMPDLNGVEAAREIRRAVPECEVLVLTMYDDETTIRDLVQAGVRGYVMKSDAGRMLVGAIDAVAHHRPFFAPRAAHVALEGFLDAGRRQGPTTGPRPDLTPREREVLRLLAEGRTGKQAAHTLGISIKTIDTHRARIMQKLGAHSVVELVRYAVRSRLIEP